MLPSELLEEGVIQICSNGGIIEFHRYYGELRMIAKSANGYPGDCTGLQIPATEEYCDGVYRDWQMRIANRDAGIMPSAWEGLVIKEFANSREGQCS